jgi:membrane protein YdbS with pleckstrin-like domain
MKQSKGVLITQIIVVISLLVIYYMSLQVKITNWTPMFLVVYMVGFLTVWNYITKFVEWNFKPENYAINQGN